MYASYYGYCYKIMATKGIYITLQLLHNYYIGIKICWFFMALVCYSVPTSFSRRGA